MPVKKTKEADLKLRDAVIQQLDWEPEITSTDILVSVKDGVVALNGYVHSYFEKIAAEKAAKSTFGVAAVANDIEVKPSTIRTDPEIAREAVHALEAHVSVPAEQIKVTVGAGYVTLEGKVNWYFQRRAAEEALRNLPGVRGISNLITIQPVVSAGRVQARIEEAFRRSADVDSKRVRVQTDGGKVELFGTVKSFAEREEAERAAWSAPGVVQVVDHIAIAP